MANYTPIERFKIVELYIENKKSIDLTQRAFHAKFPQQKTPDPEIIRALYSQIKSTGSLIDVLSPIKQHKVQSNRNINIAQDYVVENPNVRINLQKISFLHLFVNFVEISIFFPKNLLVMQISSCGFKNRWHNKFIIPLISNKCISIRCISMKPPSLF